MEEIWKDINGYEGKYQISNLGRVKSLARTTTYNDGRKKFIIERILQPILCKIGYYSLGLSLDGVPSVVTIHRLVALTFIPNPENKRAVNHKNGVKTDNRVENLEWVTDSENCSHYFRELGGVSPFKGKTGALNHNSKPIDQLSKNGEFIRRWDSMMGASRSGYCQSSISHCCNNIRKSTGGFKWRFAKPD